MITNSHYEHLLSEQLNCIEKFFTKHLENLPLILGESVWGVAIEFNH